jgi:hypothetical protein
MVRGRCGPSSCCSLASSVAARRISPEAAARAISAPTPLAAASPPAWHSAFPGRSPPEAPALTHPTAQPRNAAAHEPHNTDAPAPPSPVPNPATPTQGTPSWAPWIAFAIGCFAVAGGINSGGDAVACGIRDGAATHGATHGEKLAAGIERGAATHGEKLAAGAATHGDKLAAGALTLGISLGASVVLAALIAAWAARKQ